MSVDRCLKSFSYICSRGSWGLPLPYHSLSKAAPAAGSCPMEDKPMRRKPKMHNEHEFDIDNIYQEDDRQLEILEEYTFEGLTR